MAITTTANITNLQEKVIGPARLTLKDDALAIKSSYWIERGRPGMDDTYNSPKMPGVTAFGLTEGLDMSTETLVDSNVPVSATEVGVAVEVTEKNLRTLNQASFLRDVGKAMGSGINVKQEQDLATLIDGYGTAVGLDGSSATIGQLGAALAQLRGATEPLTEPEFTNGGVNAVIGPYGWHDLSQQFFPTGSGDSHAPMAAQNNRASEGVLNRYWPTGEYFGTPVKISNNLVTATNDIRAGVFHRKSGLMYEWMPVGLKTSGEPITKRSLTLMMVIDYGFVEILDGHGREWDMDNTSPTS